MSREEEIKQYCADQGFPYGACSGISSVKAIVATEAIKWADKTMSVKACEWIKANIDDDILVDCGSVIKCMSAEEFSDYFRKAMEK